MEKDTEEMIAEGKGAEAGNSGETGLSPKEMMERFDEVLGNHVERLLGTRTGIESLSMNLLNLSYIILIAARETEIESFPYLPPPRYTNEKISDELTEISIDPGEDLESVTLDMAAKGYLDIASDGRFFAGKPAIAIARLIDRVFPNMPGLNLVAYWGQMMDEVHADRKDLEVALTQFDQMLSIQGVLPRKQPKQDKTHKDVESALTKQASHKKDISRKPGPGNIKPANIFSLLETTLKADVARTVAGQPQHPSRKEPESNRPDEDDAAEINDKGYIEDNTGMETREGFPGNDPRMRQAENTIADEIADESAVDAEEPDKGPGDRSPGHPEGTSDLQASEEEEARASGRTVEQAEKETAGEEEPRDPDDDYIERQIAAFENKLGMKCPLCRTGEIRAEETARGKKYFRCSNRECNVISWGRPFHLECPQCRNPFLIEAQRGDKAILKCPRATCHYWQNFPWETDDNSAGQPQAAADPPDLKNKPRVKVRRRRVVRRKK